MASAATLAASTASALPVQVSARAYTEYTDDGLKRDADYEPTKTANVYQGSLKLGASLAATDHTTAHGVVDLLNEKDVVERAVLEWRSPLGFAVLGGKDYVHAGGWEGMRWDDQEILVSPYRAARFPWARSEPSLAISLLFTELGTLTLQAINDVVVGEDAAAGFSHSHRQPSLLLEFLGSGAKWQPLAQVGTYDIQHSILGTIGAAYHAGPWSVQADLVLDYRNKPPSYDHKNTTKYRTGSAAVTYALSATELSLKVVMMDAVQPGGPYGVDHKGNQPGVEFDDNALDCAWTVRYRLDGDAFKPYVSLIRRSGRFLKSSAEPRGPSHEKVERTLQVGVTSRF